ncbi:MAG TPA: hypothetical protein VM536_02610 [Chloroflexia bacterium]|nr:hypothetical protein [Chloroflexia bacterium]
MPDLTEFTRGQEYTNRRGTFTVLDLHPPTMRVRYTDGQEETLDIVIQLRIQRNMALPPRTPEPPPRRKTGPTSPTKVAAPVAGAKPAGARAAAPSMPRPARAPAAPRARKTGAAPLYASTTLAQLAAMSDKEQSKARTDGLIAALSSPETFTGLMDRSREAEHGHLHVYPVAQVNRIHESDQPPTPQEPELFLARAIAQNRAYLAAEGQEILTWRFPLYEAGSERYWIDLLCYDERGKRAILVCVNSKTTVRRWLWEALLDSLRNWAAVVATPGFAEALEDNAVEATPMLAILGPRGFWTDNAPGAGAHTDEVATGHMLNRRLLAAVEDWLRLPIQLLQVPDDWLRTADQLDHPSITLATFSRGVAS